MSLDQKLKNGTLSRRDFLKSGVGATGALVLGACGGGGGSGPSGPSVVPGTFNVQVVDLDGRLRGSFSEASGQAITIDQPYLSRKGVDTTGTVPNYLVLRGEPSNGFVGTRIGASQNSTIQLNTNAGNNVLYLFPQVAGVDYDCAFAGGLGNRVITRNATATMIAAGTPNSFGITYVDGPQEWIKDTYDTLNSALVIGDTTLVRFNFSGNFSALPDGRNSHAAGGFGIDPRTPLGVHTSNTFMLTNLYTLERYYNFGHAILIGEAFEMTFNVDQLCNTNATGNVSDRNTGLITDKGKYLLKAGAIYAP